MILLKRLVPFTYRTTILLAMATASRQSYSYYSERGHHSWMPVNDTLTNYPRNERKVAEYSKHVNLYSTSFISLLSFQLYQLPTRAHGQILPHSRIRTAASETPIMMAITPWHSI